MSSLDSDHSQPLDFEADAGRVLRRLRTTLAEVVANVPGPVAKPAELQRSLGIDINLSCKIFRVVNTPGSLGAAAHVPGLSGLRTFLRAASRAGVREQLLGEAAVIAKEFDQLVTSHAGDRPAFDTMVSAYADSSEMAQVGLQHRRALFRGHRHILGLQAKAQVVCFMLQPSESDPDRIDVVRVAGVLDLRRLQPSASLLISRTSLTTDDGTLVQIKREPLVPAAESGQDDSLLPEFCSQPLPEYRTVQPLPGVTYGELLSNGVGKKAAITCFEGAVFRSSVPRYRQEDDQISAYCTQVRMPSESLLLDVMIRDDIKQGSEPIAFTVLQYQRETNTPGSCDESLRLKPYETVSHLGKGPSVLFTPDYPRYVELGEYVFDRLGWDGDRFDTYRCRVEYPLLPSAVAMRFDLPEEPPT